MNILAIGAHPDDVDILAGGTLARYSAAGHHVTIAVATNGNVGSPTLSSEEIAAIRHREAQAACDVIGADLIWMGFDDEWLFDNRESRTAFIDAYRAARPDIVLVHHTSDYHPDHRNAGQIAQDARIPATVRLVTTARPHLDKAPALYAMDIVGADTVPGLASGTPTHYVDITSVIDTRLAMGACHVSQVAWLESIFDRDFDAAALAQNAFRGAEIGVTYAEAFTFIPTFPVAAEVPPLGEF